MNYVFGLPFLDPSEVSDCFIFDLVSVQPQDERLQRFSDYLIDTYLSENAVFPPTIWDCFTSSLERTTNCCESFHSRFNSRFYKAHPCLNNFINILLEFQTDSYIKLKSVNEPVRIKNPVTRRRNEFLKHKISRYHEMGRLQYVKCLGYFNKQ